MVEAATAVSPAIPQSGDGPIAGKKLFWTRLYFQLPLAIALGVLIGHYLPTFGEGLKPLGDTFIRLVKVILAPVIFLTLATGIANLRHFKRRGKVVGKAFAYFLALTTLALIVGLIEANLIRPGPDMSIDPEGLAAGAMATYAARVQDATVVGFLMNIIPDTVVGAFADGEVLQVLFFSILFGISLAVIGDRADPVLTLLESVSEAFFKMVAILVKVASIVAFGAFAFMIGRYGIASVIDLTALMGTPYGT